MVGEGEGGDGGGGEGRKVESLSISSLLPLYRVSIGTDTPVTQLYCHMLSYVRCYC